MNGNLIWKYEMGWGIDSNMIVSGGTLFVGSNDNNFYALNKNNGNLYWYFSCTSGIHSYPIIYENYILFGSDDGRFYNINKNLGNLIWNFSPGRTINSKINYFTTPIRSKPVVYNDVVFINLLINKFKNKYYFIYYTGRFISSYINLDNSKIK